MIMRATFGVILGLILSAMVISATNYVCNRIFPPSEEAAKVFESTDSIKKMREEDPEKLKALMGRVLLPGLFAWAFGVFAGAALAARFAEQYAMLAALTVGVLNTVWTLMALSFIPHPVWIEVLGLCPQVPLAFLAGRLVKAKLAAR